MKYYLCVMEKRKPYNDLGDFLRKCFAWKVQKISINAGFTCPNRDGTKDGVDVRIVIIRHSVRNIVIQRKASRNNWKRAFISFPENIRR